MSMPAIHPSDRPSDDDEAPEYDYPHLPGEELDPLMESSLHSRWLGFLLTTVTSALAHTDALVTGNTPFVPSGTKYHTAPDVVVLPGLRGQDIGRYVVDEYGVVPTVCVEIVSPSNTWPRPERRYRRWLEAGVPEVYAIYPKRQQVQRIELVDGEIVRSDALGQRSEALNLTFTLSRGLLGLCCLGGQVVTLEDDAYALLSAERERADAERERADAERERADAERERADALAAELERIRGE